jgi:peptide/nickel transport system ATP-binding protein
MRPLLDVSGLSVTFRGAAGRVAAVVDADLTVSASEVVGLVGGSGAGKSTIARAVAGLERAAAGCIRFDGVDLTRLRGAARRRRRRGLHLVFQDPYAALPPTLPVGRIVAEPLVIHRLGDRSERVHDALAAVHLAPERYLHRYPHQLSGGERQRVAFARALVTEPRLLLADEPTQMLDASLRAGIADLLEELRTRRGVAVLHITHDLALAQRCCDRLVVLRAGRVVEDGPTDAVLSHPEHPYTRALIDAARRLHSATA